MHHWTFVEKLDLVLFIGAVIALLGVIYWACTQVYFDWREKRRYRPLRETHPHLLPPRR